MRLSDYTRRKAIQLQALLNRRRILIIEDLAVGYIPIYKVASTSIRSFLCRRHANFPPEHSNPEFTKEEKQKVERSITKSMGARRTRRLREKYFLFTYVRNPAARLYSLYLDKVLRVITQGKRFNLGLYGIEPDINFEEFAIRIAGIPDSSADKHFRSQYLQIYHRGEWLVNFIGKFENMQEDWRTLAEQTGLEKISDVSRTTGAGSELDKLPLSPETARLISRRYQQDIDLLGYREEIEAWLARKTSN